MLRATVRTLRTSPGRSKIFAVSPLAQFQARGSAQAVNTTLRKPGESLQKTSKREFTIPLDDLFEVDAGSLGFGRKKGRNVRGKALPTPTVANRSKKSPNPPKTAKQNSGQPRPPKKDMVIYSVDYISSTNELPTAEHYRIKLDPVAKCSSLLKNSELSVKRENNELSPKITTWKYRSRLTITTPEYRLDNIEGHGMSLKEAAHAADLHAICQLHKQGLLKDILPGGIYAVPVSVPSSTLRQEANAKMDIIDFAARHDCLPKFTFQKSPISRGYRAHVSIPELGLDAYGKATDASRAILEACINLKAAAESRHEEIGEGTLLVKDYTTLNTESSEYFVQFYCREKNMRPTVNTFETALQKAGGHLTTNIILQPKTSNIDLFLGVDPFNNAPREVMYEGIAMMSKAQSEAVAYLVTALALKKEHPELWKTFEREMRRGRGEILKPLAPIDVGVESDTVEIMKNTCWDVAEAEKENTFDDLNDMDEQTARQPRSSRQLTEAKIQMKSDMLKRRLALYEMHPSLAELRRKRSELPMVQYKDQVMKMVNENDVCVVVGATGSGKTTQLPQLILEELILAGKGGTCNILCTQPRRIAAISVAERVAVERNEPLQQSIGYSVRFNAKPPKLGGSIHYCTTGILLKRMQDNQDETLNSISHIIVDEVHERDLNNDYLLVILRQLMADRKATGKPPIKVILMSATIDTTLFCKYFGVDFEGGRCPYIEVPGRTFPVTTHYLEDIYSELSRTYSKTEASALFEKESRDYIDREVTNLPKLSAPSTADSRDDDVDENKAVIDWKSKGSLGDNGELDVVMDKEDTLTPTGIMAVTIAHLLKTTTEGSILVFLPGLQEIIALEKLLNNTRPLGINFAQDPNYKVYTLHSSIPQMQQEVFEKLQPGQRKVILATNIAETSITIPDVVYVVDSSKHRETQYDRERNISNLVSTWTAKSNARQRAGRAGRVQHGHYYTMASKARYESFESAQKPEILRTDLQTLCLQIKSMGYKDVWSFLRKAIEPPDQGTVETALDELQALKAVDSDMNMTPLGRLLASLPLTPSLGKMVVLGAIFKCLDPILILAAASTSKDPFLRPALQRDEAHRIKLQWAKGTGSDHMALINAFQEWRDMRTSRVSRREQQMNWQFAHDNFLHYNTLIHISQVAQQILETLEESGIVEKSSPLGTTKTARALYGCAADNVNSASQPLVVALATAGFYPNIAVQSKYNNPRFLRTVHENEAAIHVSSVAAPVSSSGKRWGPITAKDAAPYGTIFTFSQKTQADGQVVNLRSISTTHPLAVILFGGQLSEKGRVITVDEWIPFYVPKEVRQPLLVLDQTMERYLDRTFARLRASNQRRVLDQPTQSPTEGFLNEDRARTPLIQGIVQVLEKCASKEQSRSTLYPERPVEGQSNSEAWSNREDIFRESESERSTQSRRLLPARKTPNPNLEDIFKRWIKG